MKIFITKGDATDVIEVRRDDGSRARTRLPHKGPVPHDAVHFFVESALGIDDGFWGLVANGRHPEKIAKLAKAAGHPSAARPERPDDSFVPIIQAERVVECFEADLWGGGGDPNTFREAISAGCEQSCVPNFPMSDGTIANIRAKIADFRERWDALPVGASCRLDWLEARPSS